MTLAEFISSYGSFAGLLSLILGAFFLFYYRKRDVSDAIDKENVDSQSKLLNTLRIENEYLKGENKTKDEKINSLQKQLEAQTADFQRQIDEMKKQIDTLKEINSGRAEITALSDTLNKFLPLLNDVRFFRDSHSKTLKKLDVINKKLGIKDEA